MFSDGLGYSRTERRRKLLTPIDWARALRLRQHSPRGMLRSRRTPGEVSSAEDKTLNREQPGEVAAGKCCGADKARTTSIRVGRSARQSPSSWRSPTEGLRSRGNDRRATKTARAEEALEKLRRWEWENENARETAHEDTAERHCWLLEPTRRVRALKLMQHQPRAHRPRGVPARGDSARWIILLGSRRRPDLFVTGLSASELGLQHFFFFLKLKTSTVLLVEAIGLGLKCLKVALVLLEFAASAIFVCSATEFYRLELVADQLEVALFGAKNGARCGAVRGE